MTLFRAAARTMLASYFVVNGVKALRNPDELVPVAEPLVDKVVPLVKQYAPEQVADKIPEDTATLIRINGVLQLVGGLALATGKGRRLGAAFLAASLIPATIAKHPFWTRATPEEKAADRVHFLKNVSLLGGVLLAARDTEGRPSLAWRAQKTSAALTRDSKRTSKKIAKAGHELGDQGRELAEGAIAGGTALIGSVVATTRKARKQAAKELKKNAAIAQKQLEEAKKAAEVAAKRARKEAPKLAKQARKAAEEARKAAEEAAKKARKEAPKLAKQADQARKEGAKAAKKALEDRSKAIKKARKRGGTFVEQKLEDGSKLAEQLSRDAGKVAENVADQAQSALESAKKSAASLTKNIQLGDN